MPHLRRPPRTDQLDLFSPPLKIPNWRTLPPEVQQQICQLLAKLFQSNREARSQATEVSDE